MYLDASIAHWISAHRDRFAPDAPPIEMRLMTKFAPPGSIPNDGIPRYARASARFVRKLLAAWVPLLLHPARPRLRWPPAAC